MRVSRLKVVQGRARPASVRRTADGRGVRIAAAAALSTLALSTPALASNGGTVVPDSSPGGVVYGQAVRVLPVRPVLRRFAFDPRRVVVRVDRQGSRRIGVTLQLVRGRSKRVLNRTIVTGRPVTIALPRLGPGHWTIRLRVNGGSGEQRGRLVVPRPKRKVVPPPAPPPPPRAGGVFPVAGPHSYGDGVGAKRNGHTHQGQDVVAAQGTPVVAPVGGTVLYTDYQARAAGYYVVEHAADGRDFFFAHCQKGSFAVSPGQAVSAGQRLCLVGHSGDASGPHLHFEIWLGGWRVDANSHFIDPLPTLKSWDRG
jgi:murein DD-endopeptidase MepM/ murein hydrolase activator NlpD